LDDALRLLLKGHDVFFFYGAEEKKPAGLKAVWVYPSGQGRGLMPVEPDAWASIAELIGDLADPEPAVRARAVEALVERKGQQSLQPVLQALSDPEEEVRYRALNSAIQSALDLPRDFLWGLLAYDPSPAVRFLVLTAMTGPLDTLNTKDPSAVRSIAEFALTDSDPNVSLQAEQILANLETASQAQDTIEPIQGEEGATYGVENE
jgi:HEAT repeat protein